MTEDNKTELLLGNLTPEAVDRIKALVDEFEAKGQPISVGETIDLNDTVAALTARAPIRDWACRCCGGRVRRRDRNVVHASGARALD